MKPNSVARGPQPVQNPTQQRVPPSSGRPVPQAVPDPNMEQVKLTDVEQNKLLQAQKKILVIQTTQGQLLQTFQQQSQQLGQQLQKEQQEYGRLVSELAVNHGAVGCKLDENELCFLKPKSKVESAAAGEQK